MRLAISCPVRVIPNRPIWLPAEYLIRQMAYYKDGTRKDDARMGPIANGDPNPNRTDFPPYGAVPWKQLPIFVDIVPAAAIIVIKAKHYSVKYLRFGGLNLGNV